MNTSIVAKSTKYPLPPAPPCALCGGNKSMRVHQRAGLAAHNLCVARLARGLTTPSLGDDVVPTQPNRDAVPVTLDRARALCAAQVIDRELAELAAQYIATNGSCVWHAVSVVAATPCPCAECVADAKVTGGVS